MIHSHLPQTIATPRLSANQETVLHWLTRLEEPASAQMLHTQLRQQKKLGLATVYRILEALKLQGLVQSRTAANGEALYSPIQQDQHYLTCLQCGRSTPLEDCPVSELEQQLRQAQSFKIYYHTLEFFGLCEPCVHQAETG